MKAIPLKRKDADAYISRFHRHHKPSQGDMFRFGCADDSGNLVGIIQVGRPVARKLDNGETLEVIRCCTDGTQNACSFLYSRAARIAKELGYKKIITYILQTENGSSLKASGWKLEDADCGGTSWNVYNRPREVMDNRYPLFGEERKYPAVKKQRWAKDLS